MPFPCERESDVESDIGVTDMGELTQKKKFTKRKTDCQEGDTDNEKEKVSKTVVTFQKIDPTEYALHEETIKSCLKESKDQEIHFKFPKTGTIKAQRHPTPSDILVYTLPAVKYDGVDFEYPSTEFPKGFVNFTDTEGNRLKCVPYWNGKRIIYILNEKAEVRLCANLFAGSTKGGKVRWDRGVMPLNLIPGRFSEFAVSDKVLLHKLKGQYPELLRAYNATFTAPSSPSKINAPLSAIKLLTPKQDIETNAHKRKRDAEEPPSSEMKDEKPVKKVKRKLFTLDEKAPPSPVNSPSVETKVAIPKDVTGFRFTIEGSGKMVYIADVKDTFYVEEMCGNKPGKLLFGKKNGKM